MPLKETPFKAEVAMEAVKADVVTVTEVYNGLKEYRLKTSRSEGIKPYMIFNNEEIETLIKANPKSKNELLKVKGFGEKKVEKYGEEILKIIRRIPVSS